MIGFNLINAAHENNVKKLINLGSACIYPRNSPQPIKENYLLSSYLERTNEGYALAKFQLLNIVNISNKDIEKTSFLCSPQIFMEKGIILT